MTERLRQGVTPEQIEAFRLHQAAESEKYWLKLQAELPQRVADFNSEMSRLLADAVVTPDRAETLVRLVSHYSHETPHACDVPVGVEATKQYWRYWLDYYNQINNLPERLLVAMTDKSGWRPVLEVIQLQIWAHLATAERMLEIILA